MEMGKEWELKKLEEIPRRQDKELETMRNQPGVKVDKV